MVKEKREGERMVRGVHCNGGRTQNVYKIQIKKWAQAWEEKEKERSEGEGHRDKEEKPVSPKELQLLMLRLPGFHFGFSLEQAPDSSEMLLLLGYFGVLQLIALEWLFREGDLPSEAGLYTESVGQRKKKSNYWHLSPYFRFSLWSLPCLSLFPLPALSSYISH